ncbi:MAG: hypothetical protein NTX66_02190 [Candidatus Falkowbacteria bacterium]|nr:hypothetical protein [Candidatus Falkowbacteria bacterium]
MKETSNYQWFVEPLDAHTNESIARLLLDAGCFEENLMQSVLKTDGQAINAIRLPEYRFLALIRRSVGTAYLNIKVYNRASPRARIRECSFLKKKKAAPIIKKKAEKVSQ